MTERIVVSYTALDEVEGPKPSRLSTRLRLEPCSFGCGS
jgi:hypothetical protein